ncbi:MAG: Tartrate dehydratase alpha subunit [Candidatus Methanocomedens sp.]|nr:MAG: Tartrate dehydratase alpha subunit [ANME-2 cluster archaeon]
MNALKSQLVTDAVEEIIRQAQTKLPPDVVEGLVVARDTETDKTATAQLDAILENISIADDRAIPMCQDTGILVFFVEIGRDACIVLDLDRAIREGVKQATNSVPLRPNAVEPLTRLNSGDNTGDGLPDINYSFKDGKDITITVVPKGAGSENMSAFTMLKPSQVGSVKDFVVETVQKAGGMPCPPIIVGVGIGGSFDKSARLAKRSLLRNLGDMDEYEQELLEAINSLGIGPMGLGGRTTALAVHVEKAHCHTASLPVAVNIQCWANRHASVTLDAGHDLTHLSEQYKTMHHLTEQHSNKHHLVEQHLNEHHLAERHMNKHQLAERHMNKHQLAEQHSNKHQLAEQHMAGKNVPHHLTTPLTQDDIMELQAGDIVYLSGTIYTARDEAHLRILELTDGGKPLPFDLEGAVLYHCGPLMQKNKGGWRTVAAGPTTSARMTDMTPQVLDNYNVRAIIGKGGMKNIAPALEDRCVYLAYTGGCAALAVDMIKDVRDVHWLDLGMPEAVWVLEVENFGPLIVGVDAKGRDLYEEVSGLALK